MKSYERELEEAISGMHPIDALTYLKGREDELSSLIPWIAVFLVVMYALGILVGFVIGTP